MRMDVMTIFYFSCAILVFVASLVYFIRHDKGLTIGGLMCCILIGSLSFFTIILATIVFCANHGDRYLFRINKNK